MAKGKIISYAADGTPTTYYFKRNFLYNNLQKGYVDRADMGRSPDGTLHCLAAPGSEKRTFTLPFATPQEQLEALTAAWATHRGVDLYLDASAPLTCTALIIKAPVAKPTEGFAGGAPVWSYDLEIEEI